MTTGKSVEQQAAASVEARRLLDDAWARAKKVYKEAKEQADIVYKQAKKLAVDKETKKAADEAYKEAVKEAQKLRDAITNEAQAVFVDFWKQTEIDSQEAIAKSKERSDQAKTDYKEAKARVDIAHKEATGQAVDKEAKKAADEARKEALNQAKKDHDEAIGKGL
jgi:colicin import membrane protein